jgi:hypothetical protein
MQSLLHSKYLMDETAYLMDLNIKKRYSGKFQIVIHICSFDSALFARSQAKQCIFFRVCCKSCFLLIPSLPSFQFWYLFNTNLHLAFIFVFSLAGAAAREDEEIVLCLCTFALRRTSRCIEGKHFLWQCSEERVVWKDFEWCKERQVGI